MVETADVDATEAGTVDQLQRGHRFVGKLEDREAATVVERDPAEVDVAQGGVEAERTL